jgi:hypothetical protein
VDHDLHGQRDLKHSQHPSDYRQYPGQAMLKNSFGVPQQNADVPQLNSKSTADHPIDPVAALPPNLRTNDPYPIVCLLTFVISRPPGVFEIADLIIG